MQSYIYISGWAHCLTNILNYNSPQGRAWSARASTTLHPYPCSLDQPWNLGAHRGDSSGRKRREQETEGRTVNPVPTLFYNFTIIIPALEVVRNKVPNKRMILDTKWMKEVLECKTLHMNNMERAAKNSDTERKSYIFKMNAISIFYIGYKLLTNEALKQIKSAQSEAESVLVCY